MMQPSLWDVPKHHRADPDTAQAAARKATAAAITHRQLIIRALEGLGSHGATHDELDAHFNWRPGTANRRLCELRQAGRVVRTKRRRPTRTGSPARVYCLPSLKRQDDEID